MAIDDILRRDLRGRRSPNAKLTVDRVRLIRKWAQEGKRPREIAVAMSVAEGTVRDVIRRRTWNHV